MQLPTDLDGHPRCSNPPQERPLEDRGWLVHLGSSIESTTAETLVTAALIEAVMRHRIPIDGRVLHVGIGCSVFARTLAIECPEVEVIGLTVHPAESDHAKTLIAPRYITVVGDKYRAVTLSRLGGAFDAIVDVNPNGFACCLGCFLWLWKQYARMLAPAGAVWCERRGIGWASSGSAGIYLAEPEIKRLCDWSGLQMRRYGEVLSCVKPSD